MGPAKEAGAIESLGSRWRLVECPFLSREQSGELTWEQGAETFASVARATTRPSTALGLFQGQDRGLRSRLLPVFPGAPPEQALLESRRRAMEGVLTFVMGNSVSLGQRVHPSLPGPSPRAQPLWPAAPGAPASVPSSLLCALPH